MTFLDTHTTFSAPEGLDLVTSKGYNLVHVARVGETKTTLCGKTETWKPRALPALHHVQPCLENASPSRTIEGGET